MCQNHPMTRDLRIDMLEHLAQTASSDAERFLAHTSWTTEGPIATLRAFTDSSAATALTPKLAEAAQGLLRRLRLDDRPRFDGRTLADGGCASGGNPEPIRS